MSYARFSPHSDVYVFAHYRGFVECCGCLLDAKWDYHSPAEIVAHLREHVAAGHDVPEHLLDEGLYGPDDFIAACSVFMCRETEGHDGPHSPHRWNLWGVTPHRCPCGFPESAPIHKIGAGS